MKTLLNDQWLFAKLPAGSTRADAEKAVFIPVDLPHDWLIWQAEDLYETADAWYRRELRYTPDNTLPVTILSFDGVYMDCDVLLNGEVIASHPYGYTAFTADLTGKLREGMNLLEVHIRHRSPNSRWYSGSGIYRDVTLLRLPGSYLVPDGLALQTEPVNDGWRVDFIAETAGPDGMAFECSVTDGEGKPAASCSGKSADGKISGSLQIGNGEPWSPEDPVLYTLTLIYGKQTEVRKIGLRTVALDPDRGLILNGKRIKLRGVCLHHDLGALGAAFHEKAARRQLRVMKEMGVNAVRTSHNPPASAFLDLCDEMGILVDDEAFDMWERSKTEYDYARFFPAWAAKDTASWIRRDRCHPSVILWSIGNEIYDMHADLRGTEVTKFLAEQVRKNDPYRHGFVTFGCNYMPWEGGQRCAEYVDAVGYNYGEKLYEAHHRTHPGWVIYGSETASVLSSRGIYHFPIEKTIMSEADRQCSALGNSNTSWGATDLRKMLADDAENPYSMGQFVWSGIDYIGEPTPYQTRNCYFGQADTACFPKDPYYLFRAFWTGAKDIHIGVSWDWNPGQLIDVPVMTGCAEAELLVNGRSLGRRAVSLKSAEACLPVWKIPFEPGELRARGYDSAGNMICEDVRHTPGETALLALTAEDPELLSDGWDITFVSIQALDEKGYPVDNARDRVRIRVSGGGCLLGTDNGDSTDEDGYKTDCRRLFNGRLLLIIGSTGEEEDVTVRTERECGGETVLTIPVRKTGLRPGLSRSQRVLPGRKDGRIPVRKIVLEPEGTTDLTKEQPECSFRYCVLPPNASDPHVRWEVTNEAGIPAPFVTLTEENGRVTVRAAGDGQYYLRALWGESEDRTDIISQTEFRADGTGSPALNACAWISAGLYDLSSGEIGAGNDKGISFERGAESMAGFSRVDFGETGSDRMTADIFALDGTRYDIELFDGDPRDGGRLVTVLNYQKPSIWNVYQAETWTLPERLTGIHTLCFRMRDKVHMKGFVFEKQEKAYLVHTAGSAGSIYGDSFRPDGNAVREIGNNVSLTWDRMNFGGEGEILLEIEGTTPLPVNTISVHIRNSEGAETVFACDFSGTAGTKQLFRGTVPAGMCAVTFVFLPGSRFDFESFRFMKEKDA